MHSVIYYQLNDNIISDALFDKWANELRELQQEFPDLAAQGHMADEFANWTGDTGMHLPATDRVVSLAHQLLRSRRRDAGEE